MFFTVMSHQYLRTGFGEELKICAQVGFGVMGETRGVRVLTYACRGTWRIVKAKKQSRRGPSRAKPRSRLENCGFSFVVMGRAWFFIYFFFCPCRLRYQVIVLFVYITVL